MPYIVRRRSPARSQPQEWLGDIPNRSRLGFLWKGSDINHAAVPPRTGTNVANSSAAVTIHGTGQISAGNGGISPLFTGSQAFTWGAAGIPSGRPEEATLFALVRLSSTANEVSIFGFCDVGSASTLFRLEYRTDGNRFTFQMRDNIANRFLNLGASAKVVGTTDTYSVVGVYRAGAGLKEIWVDGVQENTSTYDVTATAPFTLNRTDVGVLSRTSPSQYFNGEIFVAGAYDYALSEGEILSLSENMYRPFHRRRTSYFFPTATGGGGDTSITPANGSTTLVGYAPSLISPQSITPAAGGLSITGLASALSTAFNLTPDVGTLSIQGYAPSLAQNFSISPDTGALSLLGSAPGLIQGFLLTPDTGSLALSGYAPSLGTAGSINPSEGTLTLVGYQPGITQQSFIVPGAGTLTLTGLAPSVAGAGTLIPSESNLTLVGYQPGVTQQTFIVPGVGAIAVETHAPLLVGNTYVVPGVGAATFAGYAPTVGLGTIVTPSTGQILLAGGTPSVVTDSGSSVITPASGSLGFIGYAPTSLTAVFVAGNGRVFWLPAQSVEWVLRAQSTQWVLR